jgi:hypothetical protein
MKTYPIRNPLFAPALLICLASSALAQPGEPVQPMRWVKNDTYGIKYRVPTRWRQHTHATDTMTRVVYTCPDEGFVLTVTKQKSRGRQPANKHLLDTLTQRHCPKDRLVFQTRYNRLSFWEATGTRNQTGRYDALVTVHAGNVIAVQLEAHCRAAYRRHEELIQQILGSLEPHRKSPRGNL